MTLKEIEKFKEKGFLIFRNFFNAEDINRLTNAFDEIKFEALKHHSSFRHKNLLYIIQNDPKLGKILRFCHWPSYSNQILESYRTDKRILDLIKPYLGESIKSITNQVIWKTPGAQQSSYGLHQDSRFRRPVSAYRNMESSCIQTSLAVDKHTVNNGCLKFIEGSHKLGEMNYFTSKSIFEESFSAEVLKPLGLQKNKIVDIILEPGDLVIWQPYLFHGSGPNTSNSDRRSYTNAYMIADDCDRGEWAFKQGATIKLGEPVLVQYENLFKKPEPHYISGPPNPFKNEN